MPMYEYRCQDCGERFEQFRWLSEADARTQCPACRSERVEREYSTFASTGGAEGTADAGCKPGPIG